MLFPSTCFVGLVDPVHCETSQGNNLKSGVKKGSDDYKLLQQGWEFGFKEKKIRHRMEIQSRDCLH